MQTDRHASLNRNTLTLTSCILLLSCPFFPTASQEQKNNKPSFLKFLNKDKANECKAEEVLRAARENGGKTVYGNGATPENITRSDVVNDAGAILDQLERHIEEWGHASFSEVVLIPDFADRTTYDFQIDNPNDYSTYERNTRYSSQGHAAITEEIVNSLGLSAGVGIRTGANAAPTVNAPITQESIFNSEGRKGFENNTTLESLQTNHADNLADAELRRRLPAQGELYSGIAIPESDIQTLASSNTVTGKVLEFMSHPVGISESQQAWIGLSQVSVSPGWRTQRDYFCEVQVAVEYARENDKGTYDLSLTDPHSLKSGDVPIPSVFAAFPLAQAQILDLNYESDTMNSTMLAIATKIAANNPVQGSAFMRRMKRLRQTLSTKNALPVVVPSSDGKSLTYRFQPSVHALSNPTNKRSGPGWRLNPVSIPALVVVICEKETLRKWDHISFTYSTRWVPMKTDPGLTGMIFNRLDRPVFPNLPKSNRKRLHNAAGIDYLVCSYFWMLENPGFLPLETRSRVVNLRNLVRSHRNTNPIPAPKPMIAQISPRSITVEELCSTGLSITGKNFLGFEGIGECNRNEVSLSFCGVPMEIETLSNEHITARMGPDYLTFLRNHEATLTNSTIVLKNKFGTCKCSSNSTPQLVAPVAMNPDGAICGFQPGSVNPEKESTIVITGYGFKDSNGTDTLTTALLGSFATDEIEVINAETAIITFQPFKGTFDDSLPLVVVGSNGVLNYEGVGTQKVPMIKVNAKPAASAEAEVNATNPAPEPGTTIESPAGLMKPAAEAPPSSSSPSTLYQSPSVPKYRFHSGK